MRKALTICVCVNAVIAAALSLYLFLIPAAMLTWNLRDPALYGGKIPPCVFRWHRALSPKYEKWARQRVRAGRAAALTTTDISGTEWPLFGSATSAAAASIAPRAYCLGGTGHGERPCSAASWSASVAQR